MHYEYLMRWWARQKRARRASKVDRPSLKARLMMTRPQRKNPAIRRRVERSDGGIR